MKNINFDPEAMYQQIKDYAMIDLIKSMVPEDAASNCLALLKAFVKNGVSVETAIKILQDASKEM